MSILKTLNKNQKEAVKHSEGPMLVVAGAGCGKTCVITNRIAYLVKDAGVNPDNILTIAYTNKEANRIKNGLHNLISDMGEDVNICTIEQLCISILRDNITELGFNTNFTIYDQEDKKKIVKECMQLEGVKEEEKLLPKDIIDYITKCKKTYIVPEAALEMTQDLAKKDKERSKARVYARYEQILKENNALDEDDFVFKTVELFKQKASLLKKYQKKFQYVLVDEYQDITTIEHTLLVQLVGKKGNIFACGNDDESMPSGFDPEASYLNDFEKNFKNAQIITLEDNYRMTKTINDLAEAIISNNSNRIEKKTKAKNKDGKLTVVYNANDERDEATYIATYISDKVITDDAKYSDFIILHSEETQVKIVEEQLKKENIPYKIYGGQKFYERKEVKDIISYLKVLLNDRDEHSIDKVINIPKRNIGNTTLDKIKACADKNNLYLYEALRDCAEYEDIAKLSYKIERFTSIIEDLKEMITNYKISEVVAELIKRTNYIKMLEDEETQDARDRIDNINELILRARFYEESVAMPTLEGFVENISLVEDTQYDDDKDVVKLMTVQTMKGEESDTVFLMGFEDGVFPSYTSIYEDKEKEDDERKLLYVALTRAKNDLHITFTKRRLKNGQANHNKISKFFEEFPENLYESKKKKVEKLEINVEVIEEKVTPMLYSSIKTSVEQNVALSSNGTDFSMDFKVGENCGHKKYGQGKIQEITPNGTGYQLKIIFDGVGEKNMMINKSTIGFFQKL